MLNLLAAPPSPLLGGVPIQFLFRLSLQEEERPIAVLYPDRGGLRVEASTPGKGALTRVSTRWPTGAPLAFASRDTAFETTVQAAMDRLGTKILHVEGLAGFPLESLLRISADGLRLVVSVHDFAAWCVRPHLLEKPGERFCGYCRDEARCVGCLGVDRLPVLPLERRAVAARLLERADFVVYPSEFALKQHLTLFPTLDPGRQHVIAPASPMAPALPKRRPRPPGTRHVAYVGAVHPHKGASLFADVVGALADVPDLRFTVFGGGERSLVEQLRRLPRVAVRGYYRAGSLPRLLVDEGVDVALLLSIWPETYGITLDECEAAGVRVVAFDLGAVGARLAGRGVVVPPEEGARGVAEAVRRLVDQGVEERAPRARPGDAAMTASAWRRLYSDLA